MNLSTSDRNVYAQLLHGYSDVSWSGRLESLSPTAAIRESIPLINRSTSYDQHPSPRQHASVAKSTEEIYLVIHHFLSTVVLPLLGNGLAPEAPSSSRAKSFHHSTPSLHIGIVFACAAMLPCIAISQIVNDF